MATFRKIHVTYWGDEFIQMLTPEQKYFYIYLLTNDRTQQCGIYEITRRKIAFDIGYNLESVDRLIQMFTDMGKIIYDQKTQEIAILNWVKYNDSTSPKVKGCVNKELLTIKSRYLIQLMGYDTPVGVSFNKNYRVGIELRKNIFDSCGNACQKCKSKENLQIDHIIPRAIGGQSMPENLRCLCRSCNTSRPIIGDELVKEITKDGYDFETLCRINGIDAYSYSISRVTQEEEEEEEEEEKEEEKEKEKEKKNCVFENLEKTQVPSEIQQSPLSAMFKIWKQHFPSYLNDTKKDFVALRQICEFILKKQPSFVPIDELEKMTDDFAKKVKSNEFYSNKALCTISNKIQDILMSDTNRSQKRQVSEKRTQLDSGVDHSDYVNLAKQVGL